MTSIQNIVGHGAAHGLTDVIEPAIRGVKYDANFAFPNALPGIAELIDANYNAYVSNTDLAKALSYHGVTLNVDADLSAISQLLGLDYPGFFWHQSYLSNQHRPTELETREIANRYFVDDGTLTDGWKRYGYIDENYRKQVTNLRYDIPGPSDLVRFSVRHIWEPDILAQIGYDAEFPGQVIDLWHAMKGLDYPLFTGPFQSQFVSMMGSGVAAEQFISRYIDAGIPEPTWARAYWWSHWVLPSPGQFFDMLIRLDPERDRSFDPPEAVGLNFALSDYELGLRANDYPPKYRKMLAAINRPIVGVRFLRSFVDTDVYTYENVVEWARRWGYSPRDQKDIADNVWKTVKGKKQKTSVCKGCATCDQAFEVGVITEQQLEVCYVGYGADPDDAKRMAQLASLKLRVKRGREIVANVRRRFLKGTLIEDNARMLLGQWGIQLERIDLYIADWRLELEAGRKELSAAQAVKFACQGIISANDLVFRLGNLGYPQADQQALVAEAAVCASNLAAQQLAKADRLSRQQQAQAYTAARRARQSLTEAQRYLASHGHPKQLHDWFCQGVIGEPEVYTRLNALGWPDTDITRFLGDCKSGKKPSGRGGYAQPVVPPLVPPSAEGAIIEGLP